MCVCVCLFALPDAFLDRIALVSLVSSSVGGSLGRRSLFNLRGERRGENDGDAEMGSLSPPKSEKPQMGGRHCTADSMEEGAAARRRGRSYHMTEQKGNSSSD